VAALTGSARQSPGDCEDHQEDGAHQPAPVLGSLCPLWAAIAHPDSQELPDLLQKLFESMI
jgi:hypothetical protein